MHNAPMTSLENFRLTVFRKVAEQLSFRKAAEELYLTQPAVSLQVKALEEELGVALFDRSGSQVRLTPAGAALLEYAEQSSRLLFEARHAVTAFSGTQSGALTLGASTTIAQYVLPRLLSEYCTAHPRVSPTLTSGNTEEIVTAVEEERIALGFIEGPPRSRDLTLTPFLEDELVLLAPAAHEWAERTEIAPQELAAAPLLMRERGSGTRHIVELAFERHHIRRSSLHVVMELDSTEAIKSAVEAGFGVGFISRWALAKDARFGAAFRIVEIKGMRFRRHFVLVSRKAHELSGPAAEFRDYVLATTKLASAGKPQQATPRIKPAPHKPR
jgi:LysR family transcriptional regulator, transcriptional activator of the cysJI operon